jgi:hypothetical protein
LQVLVATAPRLVGRAGSPSGEERIEPPLVSTAVDDRVVEARWSSEARGCAELARRPRCGPREGGGAPPGDD